MTNPYKGICSPCGHYLGSASFSISTWTEGQCVNCGRMELVTELRDFGYPATSQFAKDYSKLNSQHLATIYEANNLSLIQTIIRKIKTGRVTL